MKISELFETETSSASIATVAIPFGKVKKRKVDEDFYMYLREAIDPNLTELIDIFQNGRNGWNVTVDNKFKKNFRSYSRDTVVNNSLLKLIKFVTDHTASIKPSSHDYPPELYVHNIVKGPHSGKVWCHLKGQKIGLMFDVIAGNMTLIDIGTHQDFGWR